MTSASDRPENNRQREDAETRVGWKMAGIGMQVTSEVVAGVLLGWLFDRWRGQGHVGVIVGSICGICVGLFSLIRQSLLLNKHLDRVAPTRGRGTPLPPPPLEPERDPLWNDDTDDEWSNHHADQPERRDE